MLRETFGWYLITNSSLLNCLTKQKSCTFTLILMPQIIMDDFSLLFFFQSTMCQSHPLTYEFNFQPQRIMMSCAVVSAANGAQVLAALQVKGLY